MKVTKSGFIKSAMIGAALLVASAGREGMVDKIKVCGTKGCQEITTQEYQAMKQDLIGKAEREENFTPDEWQMFVAVMDHEIKKRKGVTLENAKLEDVRDTLIQEIQNP